MMTREQAIEAYRRVKTWERSESMRLREQILVPHFAGNLCCLHNWSLAWEAGSDLGGSINLKTYKLGKFYNWKQRQIWDEATRLGDHFARFF